MPPKKRPRKSEAVSPPEEEDAAAAASPAAAAEAAASEPQATQENDVFSDDEEEDDEADDAEFMAGEMDEDEDEDEELGGSGPAGTIAVMVVKNFMNHEHLKMELGPGINFIIGKNGSGKSAMCHAAQVALGASARDTERGSTMSGFVRHGQPSAEVRLEIRNAPREDACEWNRYGDTIVVERTLNAKGGGKYVLRAADNSIVSRKRDDLQKILDHYNIQVNNPCSVLGQDDSKKLATGSEEYKYEFYLRAAGLQTVLDQMTMALKAKKQISDILDRQGKEIPKLRAVYEKFAKEYEDASELFSLKARCERFREELAWSHVADKREEVKEHEQAMEEQRGAAEKHEEECAQHEARENELKPQVDEGLAASERFNKETTENGEKMRALRKAEDAAKKKVKEQKKAIAALKKKTEDGRKDIAENEGRIKEIREEPDEQNEEARKRQKILDKLAAVNREKQEEQGNVKRFARELDQVEDDLERYKDDEQQHKANVQRLQGSLREATGELNYLR